MSNEEKASASAAASDASVRVPTEANAETLGETNHQSILLKVDLRFLPMLCALFLFSFLDRSSLGNANIAGMPKELGLKSTQLNFALAIFFLSYGLLEVPSNILLKHVNPRYYIVFLAIVWGIITMCHGFIKNFQGLVAARVFLGLFEAGLMPACSYLMTLWYPRDKLALRVTIFFASTLLAGAFGGLLARGIMNLDGWIGISGWRWIFIIEGLMTVVVGIIAFFCLPESPAHAYFLTPTERTALTNYIKHDSGNESIPFSWSEVADAFKILHTWLSSFVVFSMAVAMYSFVFFLPKIILDFKATSATRAQLLSAPPYLFAILVLITAGYMSDRLKNRGWIIVTFMGIGCIGYIILLTSIKLAPRYVGTFFIASGLWSAMALSMGWITNNLLGQTRRAVGIAVQTTFVCAGGVVGSYIYRPKDAPAYREGHGVCLALVLAGMAVAAFQRWWLGRKNKKIVQEGEDKVLYLL